MSQWIRRRRVGAFILTFAAWALVGGCNSAPDGDFGSTAAAPKQSQSDNQPPVRLEESTEPKTADIDSSMPAADSESTAATNSSPAATQSESVEPPNPAASPTTPAEPVPASEAPTPADTVKQAEPAPVIPATPAEIHEPQVVMSEAQTAACKVKIGDPMPALSLPNLSGEVSDWTSLQGEKLTVVIFWSGVHRFAREQVQRLPKEVLQPFQGTGINVVAVHVGPMADEWQESLTQSEFASAKLLLDANGEGLTQVAVGGVPRTYLLDAAGRIVWFDVEYTRDTVRELVNAIHYQLAPPAANNS